MMFDRSPLIGLLVVAAALLVIVAAMLLMRDLGTSRVGERIDAVLAARVGSAPRPQAPLGGLGQLLRVVGERLRGMTRLYSEQDLESLESAITAAGLNASRLLPVMLGVKALLAVMIPTLTVLYGIASGAQVRTILLLVLGSLPVGLLGPEWVLHLVRRPYVAALRRGLPDALDLMVVCTEAGMGLDSALSHVAKEIAGANPAIAVALSRLLDELRVLPDRREAFVNFGRRSGVEAIQRVASMLGQTLHYGTPLAEALRSVAADLRRERMVALESRCSRLPALLVLPLILFIMPALFIVLAGSPVLRLVDSLHAMTHVVHTGN
jgi:tight adherence protein C